MKTVNDFKEYQLLAMSNGMKLESWKNTILLRPDPQIIWEESKSDDLWKKIDARYERSNTGGGIWQIQNKHMQEQWIVTYKDLKFNIKLMGFKHTGLFPEQAYNTGKNKKIQSKSKSFKFICIYGSSIYCSIKRKS